ncbi:hypothetical protein J4E89_010367 [Alternaria sp. Ai002NY15]|nr:hypothetical protein J4E89_010367 [Alternaria sp. Ai002NY15]
MRSLYDTIKNNIDHTDFRMARTRRSQPGKKHQDDDQQPKEPPVTPAPSDANLEPDTSEISDVPSNLDQELEDNLWGFLDEEVEAGKQGNEEVGGEGEGVEEVPEQAVDDMVIDQDDDDDDSGGETKRDLLDEIKNNWDITSLRSIMELGLDKVRNKQLKDTWLSGETDLADEDWDKITLRLFRDLSRITRNNFDKARSLLDEWLRYRKHDKDGKRTGSKRVTHKEPKLRNDLRGIIYELQMKREARDENDEEQGKPKRKKVTIDDDSSDVDLDDGLYNLEVDLPPGKKGKKGSKRKDSSKKLGDKSANRSGSRQDSGDDSDSSPNEIPPSDLRLEKNVEASKKVNKKPAPSKKNAKPKAKAAEVEDANNESHVNEPPPVIIIQNEEQRNAAIEYIYLIWGAGSLLYTLPDALRPAEATKDQDLAYEIVAALRNLSNVIRTPDELAAFRQDLETQMAGDTSYTDEDIVAHIARVGEPYYHAARAAGENARHPVAQSAAAQLQTEGPTTRRSPRNHNTSAIPPAGDQQASDAQALDLLAAVAAGRPRAVATTPQPPRLRNAPVVPRAPQPAEGASTITQGQDVVKSNNGNEGATQQSEQRSTQEAAGSRDAAGQPLGVVNSSGEVQPPRPPLQPVGQQPSRYGAATQDNDATFTLVSALDAVRNSEANVRVAQILRDIAALQGQTALDQANAYLEVALREQERATAQARANSFQGNREGMQERTEAVRQREEELRRIRRGDVGDAGEDEGDEDDGEPRQKTKRRKIGEGGKSGDERDMSGEGNGQGEPK